MTAKRCVMVCVTRQVSCERLIRAGAQLAKEKKLPLLVVHVAYGGASWLGNPDEGQALDYLFGIAKEHDAQLNVIRSDNVLDTLTEYARENKAAFIISGTSPDAQDQAQSFMWQLQNRLPHAKIQSIT